MGILRSATVTVKDVAAAAANYTKWYDYRLVEEGVIAPELAASWGAVGCGGRPYALLQPASGAEIFIRLVAGDNHPDDHPVATLGWSAMEICVDDVFATNDALTGSPFDIIGPPKPMESLPTIHPMQVQAPDGELSFLTQILSKVPNNGLPRPQVPIDHIFIMVAGTSDADATYDWFESRFGTEPRMTLEMTIRFINEAFDMPSSHKTRMRTAKAKDLVCFEFDGLPPAARRRHRLNDGLPSGIGMVSITHPDLDAIEGDWLAPPAVHAGAHYAGGRSGTMTGPDGIIVEVVERA